MILSLTLLPETKKLLRSTKSKINKVKKGKNPANIRLDEDVLKTS